MNFYFCEGCGKRITDADVGKGLARDKQLKGMYCATCAQGVNTMEMLPITGVEIRDDAPPKRASGSGAIPTKGAKVVAASPSERHVAAHPSPPVQGRQSNTMMIGIVASSIVVLVIAILLVPSGTKQRPTPTPARVDEPPVTQAAIPIVTLTPAPVLPAKNVPSEKEIPPEQVSSNAPPEPDLVFQSTQPVAPALVSERKPEQPAPDRSNHEPAGAMPPVPASKPVQPAISYAKFEEIVLGSDRLDEIQTAAKAALELIEPADKTACTLLMDCVDQASSVDKAVQAGLAQKKGTRIVLNRADGTRKFTDIDDDGHGGVNIHSEELAPVQLQEFTRDQVKDADARIASFVALRGDPDLAKRLVAPLDSAQRGALEKIIEVRRTRVRELKAADEIKKFKELLAKNSNTQALTLGIQIQKNYAGSKTLAEMSPSLESQIAEIQSGTLELRNIFMCDAKRLADGRIELNFDLKNQRHLMEFSNRGLPAWFTEIEADISIENDARWIRYFRLGDSMLMQQKNLAQDIVHLGKKIHQDTPESSSKKDDYYGPGGGAHRYRFKAGTTGISFQVDNGTPQVASGPWTGGRLKWPGHYKMLPTAMKITGRFDPMWLAEMAEVAKDRAKFLTGSYVELKPIQRAVPRNEIEPEMMCWMGSVDRDKEIRGLAGWNEVGPSWTAEGAEFVSPKPKDKKRNAWTSAFWPQALVAPNAELAFEARIDAGQIDVLLPCEQPPGQMLAYRFAVISNDHVKVKDISVFDDITVRKEGTVFADFPNGAQSGKWCKYQILYAKGTVTILADGKQVLELAKCPVNVVWPMQFWANQGVDYRLKNVKIRKLE